MELNLFQVAGNLPKPDIAVFTGRSKKKVFLLSCDGKLSDCVLVARKRELVTQF